MEAEATTSVLAHEPHPKTSLAAATFVLDGQRLIRLAYQDRDGNIRQANSNDNIWIGLPGIIISKDLVQPSTPLSAVGWEEEYHFFYMDRSNRICEWQWSRTGGSVNRGPIPM